MEYSELIEVRRSVRRYEPSEISADEMRAIVADALNAPSWKNTETTRYYAALSEGAKARLRDGALPQFNVTSTTGAAAFVAVSFRPGESGYLGAEPANELGEMWGAYDCGLASAYFILAAKNRGWDSLILGIRDKAKVKGTLGIPGNEILTAVIALGKGAQAVGKPPRRTVDETLGIS